MGEWRYSSTILDLGTSWRCGQLHAPGRFTPPPPRERAPGTHWIGGWLDPKAGLNDVEKKIFLTLPGPPTLTSSFVHAVASRYTDYSISAPKDSCDIKCPFCSLGRSPGHLINRNWYLPAN
jgi:hypothetical protein